MIIYLSIIITILTVFTILPFVLQLLGPKPIRAINFENDFVFLNFIIGQVINDFNVYVVGTAKSGGRALMSDKDLNEYREQMVLEVYSQLSQNYLSILKRYFSEEGLRFYIANTINNEVTKLLISYNNKFFTNTNINADSVERRDTDM